MRPSRGFPGFKAFRRLNHRVQVPLVYTKGVAESASRLMLTLINFPSVRTVGPGVQSLFWLNSAFYRKGSRPHLVYNWISCTASAGAFRLTPA